VSVHEGNTADAAGQAASEEKVDWFEQQLASFITTTKGGLTGQCLFHQVTVYPDGARWGFFIVQPNGEKKWGGRDGYETKEAAAKAALKRVAALQKARVESENYRAAPGGGANKLGSKPGASKTMLQDVLSSKLRHGKSRRRLKLGSDLELATFVCEDLNEALGETVYSEGKLWAWAEDHWVDLPEHIIDRAAHPYDGLWVGKPKEPGSWQVRLSKGKIAGIVQIALGLKTRPDYFADAPTGINCASGFIEFAADGTPTLHPHDRKYRQRHVLPGRWKPGTDGSPPSGSLLHTFLSGIFLGDP
jgi:hypothetical protein